MPGWHRSGLPGPPARQALGLLVLPLLGLWLAVLPLWATATQAQPQGQACTSPLGEGRANYLFCHSPAGPGPAPAYYSLGAGPDQRSLLQPIPTPTPRAPSVGNGACLPCHGLPNARMTFESGEKVSIYVDLQAYASSAHGDKLACADCHPRHTAYPHPKLQVTSRRDYAAANYEVCKRCHFANYTKTLDSIHYAALAAGSRSAPLCTDCHEAHRVERLDEPRSRISDRCGRCHTSIYQSYAQSVHGRALFDEGNRDVPVCTSCHGVHNIHSATSAAFRLGITGLCAKCHRDAALMARYGISPQILRTYLDDFHGKTVRFYQRQPRAIWPAKAVCVDCHGVHDITRTDDPHSPVIKANLLTTCRKCHPDATENFPAAWLSHYQPTPQKAALVYFVRLFYWILIPLMVGGLGIHILIDLWRIARNR